MKRSILGVATAFLLVAAAATAVVAADQRIKPYVLAAQGPGDVAEKVAAARQALQAAGFEVAGEYAFSAAAHVLVVTDDELKKAAAGTPTGGFAAVQRVAVTKVGEQVQVSYTNPAWMAGAYRLGSDLAGVAARLEAALGKAQEFGAKAGMTAKQLRSYHYMVTMPYFTDQVVLAEYAGHAEALEQVAKGLAASPAVGLIARVDLPGTEETLFCVAIRSGDGADAAVVKTTDTGALRHTAYLPYELLVSGKKAIMLHGKFRIAQSFPDLGMGTFMKISGAPDGIAKALKAAIR